VKLSVPSLSVIRVDISTPVERSSLLLLLIIITDLYSAFRSEDTEALDAAQED